MAEHSTDDVVFYWRPGCPFCFILRLGPRRERLSLREVNIWEDPSAAARVRAITGGDETVPTVVVGRAAMVNPTAAAVVEAVRSHAPQLLQRREEQNPGAAGRRRGWLARLWAGGDG